MPAATDQQVQQFVNERVRPWAERFRELVEMARDNRASLDDVYEALTQQSPTWTDQRTDGPPHLLSGNDVLAFNTFWADFITFVDGNAQTPIVEKACVRPTNFNAG